MGTESTLDPMAAGKGMHSEPTHGHKPVDIPLDTRSAEAAVGEDDPITGMTVDQIVASGEIPDDVHELERLMGSVVPDKGAKPDAAPAAAPAGDDPAPAAAAAVDAAKEQAAAAQEAAASAAAPVVTEAAQPSDDKDAVVLARDGKNVLPYSVLKGTRQQVTALQAKLAETETALQKALSKSTTDAAATDRADGTEAAMPSAAEVQLMTDEQLAQLTESLPENLASAVKALHASSQTMHRQISELSGRAQRDDEARKLIVAEQVQELIDKNDDLRTWQSAEDQTLWERAKAFDATLRADPEWAARPMEQRFDQAAKLVRAMLPQQAPNKSSTPTPSLAEQAAAAVARKTAGKSVAPITHSDLPAGNPAAQSEVERIEALSNSQLERMFDSAKNPDDIAAMLAKIA
jgi:hypothetical protein